MGSFGGAAEDIPVGPSAVTAMGGGVPSASRSRAQVLAWSGPGGWRESRPRLVPRSSTTGTPQQGPNPDDAFSLVELLVALLVLGILLAIAIPTFLGTSNAADDRSAQANLASALTDAKSTFESQSQTYGTGPGSDATLADTLQKGALNLEFEAGSLGSSPALGSSGSQSDVSVAVSSDGNGVVLAAFPVPGNCFYVIDNAQLLTPAVANSNPYLGTTVLTTAQPMPVGAIGLPVRAGTSYVTVAGDTDKSDCNAYRPESSGAGVTAAYQIAGFPNAPST
jgi:type IV pilus assembly protein PilA